MNSVRNIFSVKFFSIIAMGAFLFASTAPSSAFYFNFFNKDKCPCFYYKSLSLAKRQANQFGFEVSFDACTDFGNAVALEGIGNADKCDSSIIATDSCLINPCCIYEYQCGSPLLNSLDIFVGISNLSDSEFEACKRDIEKIASLKGLTCGPP
jgi:hypothetical protein